MTRSPLPLSTFGGALRAVADGLIAKAEELPRASEAGRLLRDAATSLLDADTALEREADAGGPACS